jgi:serine/threonine protein kinase
LDAKYGADGCVYYRYGSFDGTAAGRDAEVPTIRNPQGHLEEDCRESGFKPDWVSDPFMQNHAVPGREADDSPLTSTYKAFRAVAQRGRGGVYQAIDFSVTPPRLCILKEGRPNGEIDWYGRDGVWRMKNELRVLRALRTFGVTGPRVFSTFIADRNFFLTLEFIDGEDLDTWLQHKQRRISIRLGLRLAAKLARIVSQIHAAGWVWRDCKPANLVVNSKGALRPIDFEGACPITRPDPLPWGTAPFIAPEAREILQRKSRLPEDLYSLGAVIYFLLGGSPPELPTPMRLKNIRKNVPAAADEVVMDLLSSDPQRRPSAQSALVVFERLCAGN